MSLRWFSSRQHRRASDLWSQARKLRDAQCDLLDPHELHLLDTALRQTRAALDDRANDEILAARADELENAAEQSLRSYPHPEWRDNVEVFLVAIAIAMAIRTFFAQPFKIPTGSMQPTLYGVTLEDRRGDPAFVMPGLLRRSMNLPGMAPSTIKSLPRPTANSITPGLCNMLSALSTNKPSGSATAAARPFPSPSGVGLMKASLTPSNTASDWWVITACPAVSRKANPSFNLWNIPATICSWTA
jgi:hypothetical protein